LPRPIGGRTRHSFAVSEPTTSAHGAAGPTPSPEPKTGYLSLLHTDPVVLYAWDSELREGDSGLWSVLDAVSHRPSYLVVSPSWTLMDPWTRSNRAELIRSALARYPQLTAVAICPTPEEKSALERESVSVVRCSESALVREDLFTIDPARRPRFDAIYDAKWSDYKRHHLAGGIHSLALIAPPPWRPEEDCTIDYFRTAHAALQHATWLSQPWGSARSRWLTYQKINAALNEARVGLCLSRIEGVMAASIQYLLAGLPVVTTRNIGGRDEFFDPAFVRWVEDDPRAVADAVDELVALDLDPQVIREATLQKVAQHRERLQRWVRNVILAEGGELGRWAGPWPGGLPNKLREPEARVEDVLAEIVSDPASSSRNAQPPAGVGL